MKSSTKPGAVNLSRKRMGEIALLILKQKLRAEGIRLNLQFKEEIGNESSNIGLKLDEALAFTETLVRELVDETFTPRS